jgi:hypothetical protein
MNEMRNYVDQEIARVTARVDDLEEITQVLVSEKEKASVYDPDTTIVAINMPYEQGENLEEKVGTMIHQDMALNVPIVRTTRLQPPPPSNTPSGNVVKPGLVKIQFRNVDEKVKVLREKQRLSNSQDYAHVYLRSSKPHVERLMEVNIKTILDLLPGDIGKSYRVTGSGRLMKRQDKQPNVGHQGRS